MLIVVNKKAGGFATASFKKIDTAFRLWPGQQGIVCI
jgi:hypothetical protein